MEGYNEKRRSLYPTEEETPGYWEHVGWGDHLVPRGTQYHQTHLHRDSSLSLEDLPLDKVRGPITTCFLSVQGKVSNRSDYPLHQ